MARIAALRLATPPGFTAWRSAAICSCAARASNSFWSRHRSYSSRTSFGRDAGERREHAGRADRARPRPSARSLPAAESRAACRGASVISSIMNCQSRLRSTTPAKLGSLSISLTTELGVHLGARHLLGRVVEEERDVHRRADLHEMLEHHRGRRRPVIRRGGDDGGGAGAPRRGARARRRCRCRPR